MTSPVAVERQSVQEHESPDSLGSGFWYALPANNPKDDVLLPEWGLHGRDRQLRLLYRNQFNWIAQSAVAAFTHKFTQVPNQVQGGRNLATYYNSILQNADFGDGWSDFWEQVLLDYLTCDYGAYIEIIGAGRADGPIRGRVTGIAHLDSLRCIPTGNLEYPVVYWSRKSGELHRLHYTRVHRLIDMRDGDELRFGAGMSSLARAVAIIQQQIPMMRYISGQMSDIPASGVLFLPPGISGTQYYDALEDYKMRRESRGYRGEMAIGTSSSVSDNTKANRIPFSVAPEGFDYQTYIDIAVNAFAAAFGIDRQDLWPLTGKMAGTATQSEIMSEKSRGMAFGNLLAKVKRFINLKVLPASLEFDFEYRDEEKDKQVAERTGVLLDNAAKLRSLGASDEVVMRYLAMQDEQLRDVIINKQGEIVALPDDDVLADDDTIAEDDVTETVPADDAIETDSAAAKELSQAAYAYIPLANHPDVLRIQRDLKRQYPDERIEWQAAPTLHITLAFAGIMDDSAIEKLSTLIHLEAMSLQPALDEPLRYFDTPDGKALHIAIVHTSVLDAIQANVYSAFETEGYDLSAFSLPANYNPHITLAYVPDDIDLSNLNDILDVPDFVIQSNTVIIGRGDYDPQLILTAPEHVKSAKDISDTQTAFMQRFDAILADVRDDNLTRNRAGILIRGLFPTFGNRAYGDGLEAGGVPRDQMDESDNTTIKNLVAAQSAYVGNLLDVLFDKGITDAQAAGKARMWFNMSINPFFDAGRMSASANAMYEFRVGNTEHCEDCLKLNSQIHRLKSFIQSGWHPRSRKLKCKGYNCECELLKRPGASARGRLPSQRSAAIDKQLPVAA